MKLGVTYSVFDGVELLPYSIENVRPLVDYIQVVWQERNWYGTKTIKPEDKETIFRLSAEKKIDRLIKFEHPPAMNPQRAGEVERAKRSFGKDNLAAAECTHYLDIDVDEFYKPEEFKKALDYIKYWDIDYSTCHYVNYARAPIYRERIIDPGYTVFVCKFKPETAMGDLQWLDVYKYLDDSRKFFSRSKTDRVFHFPLNEIYMHHFAYWRKDMMFKFQNTSRFNLDRGNLGNLVGDIQALDKTGVIPARYFKMTSPDWQFEKVENVFNLPLEWK